MKTIQEILKESEIRARKPKRGTEIHPLVAAWPWRYSVYDPGVRGVLVAVLVWCSDVITRQEPHWLTLLGPSGIGKTFILKQALAFLRAHEEDWKPRTPTGFRLPSIVHLKPSIDLDAYDAAKEFAGRDLVYVEDVGSGQGLDKGAGAVLAGRIAELLQLRTGKWTLLCANLGIEDIETKIDGRIASRLKRDGSVLIEISNKVPDFNA